ncbi:hypothetical protein N9L48_00330 [Psychrosphaera sp.]|nr:hypothetical protein [Psychrosphaera sp.]
MALLAPFPLLLADSVMLSASQVSYHYNKTSSYLDSAASLGETAAIYELYQATGNKAWLTKAAKLGHAEAAWQLYRLNQTATDYYASDSHDKERVWFDVALQNKHPDALVQHLETLIIKQKWVLASRQIPKIEQSLDDVTNVKIEVGFLEALIKTLEIGALNSQVVLPKVYRNSIKKLNVRILKLKQNKLDKPNNVNGFEASCEVKVLVIANTKYNASKAERIIDEFHNMLPSTKTTLCFSNVSAEYRLNAICHKSNAGLLSCDPRDIKTLAKERATRYNTALSDDKLRLLIIADDGKANSRGPVIFMDKNDNAQVLLHEVGHWLNLYDEYQLRPAQQRIYCDEKEPTKLGENLIIAPINYSVESLQTRFKRTLWPVHTCKGTNNQAYKWIPEMSPMEYLDVNLTPAIQQFYNEPKLNPFHTNLMTFFE